MVVKISVIIPTLNRASLLKKALDSIINQTLTCSNYEIIVVDNGSTDNTKNLVLEYSKVTDNIYYIYETNPGLHSGRHCGFQNAKGEILVYADDDIEAFPTWLETIKKCFENENVAILGGRNLPKFESNCPDWLGLMWSSNTSSTEKILGSLSILDLGSHPKLISPYLIFGCNLAIRRNLLIEAGGFHPDGMPKDLIKYRGDGETHISQYVESKKYEALYHPEASVYHWVPNSRMTIDYFCSRAYNQGISDSFTQIRKDHNLSFGTNDLIDDRKNNFQSLYKELRQKVISKLVNVFKKVSQRLRKSKNLVPAESQLKIIKDLVNKSYKEGFNYHQQEVQKDSELLAWVLRPDYWDCKLPLQKE